MTTRALLEGTLRDLQGVHGYLALRMERGRDMRASHIRAIVVRLRRAADQLEKLL